MNRESRERTLTSQLVEALTSSLDLSEVFANAEAVLLRLLPADYMALCVSRPGRPGDYDWWVTKMPAPFLAHYPELAEHDFVRSAVVRRPNVVLRDVEMVPRRKVLERSRWYQYCRELGMPLEHVMSVLLDVKGGAHGGLTFYRERRRPFSKREQARLQGLTRLLTQTVRNCRMYGEVAARGQVLDAFFQHRGARCIVRAEPFLEELRTPPTTALLEKWFRPSERVGPSALPTVLVERLAMLTARGGAGGTGLDVWERAGEERGLAGEDLRVTFTRLPIRGGQQFWALEFQELPRAIPVPEAWRRLLTEREVEVVSHVLQGWDNQLIADHLGLALATVKKHLQNIFDKLGVEGRPALICRAALSR
ncbi:MAG TPA: LuxR C-terminal-related transcriptional regulator [Archangium sp.]|uniref:helix-turn-helix transcriptional regulator n=1 Tax=Archangium sp. TaxID=1872627 RepID=UPI002E33EA98|nr:LuxR C-terminal-related transcriptional regulator [Archangium sp.]HEX5754530.1 LuxR C-terminal-related transcriptional regulator [Archangium sp.]